MTFACDTITNPAIEDDVVAFHSWIITLFGTNALHVSYSEMIGMYRNTSWDSFAGTYGARAFNYYACTQASWFTVSTPSVQPFGDRFPIKIFVKTCQDIFDDTITEETILQNNQYFRDEFGGVNHAITYVYFTNGLFDPFYMVGVIGNLNEFSPSDTLRSKLNLSNII